MRTASETSMRGSGNPETKGTAGVAKSLMVLACLMNPVRAPPRSKATEVIFPWFGSSVSLVCVVVLR